MKSEPLGQNVQAVMSVKLTAANLIRVVSAVHVVVTLLVFPDALAVGTGELVWRTTFFKRKSTSAVPHPRTGQTSFHHHHIKDTSLSSHSNSTKTRRHEQ